MSSFEAQLRTEFFKDGGGRLALSHEVHLGGSAFTVQETSIAKATVC